MQSNVFRAEVRPEPHRVSACIASCFCAHVKISVLAEAADIALPPISNDLGSVEDFPVLCDVGCSCAFLLKVGHDCGLWSPQIVDGRPDLGGPVGHTNLTPALVSLNPATPRAKNKN